ncbi:hypothetical protein LTR53_008436 [Teratosphaeriaceae sp. CCFEE 6253]|nr:hypothetical protein LTR53_008436 [Teratosphaeriaceae sp. CCFEE 6253]
MRLPPLPVLLTWPTPNYDDPVTHGPALLIVNIVCISLVIAAVLGRLWSRLVVKQWFGVDDSLILLALLFTVGMTIVVILANEAYGWNRHEWDFTPEMIVGANKVAFAAKLMFTLAATFTRLSLICFYYRLVKDSGLRWFTWVLHASLAWTVAVCLTFLAEVIWLCIPIQAYWVFPPMAHAYCLDEGKVMLGGGVINSVSDLLTTVLPIPIVARLQMPRRQRLGVCVLLCLGFVVTIAGVVRTYFIWKSLLAQYDEPWFAYPLWIAAAVEIELAVICACAPAWKSLLRQPLSRLSTALSSKLSSLRSPHPSSRGTPSSSSQGHHPAAIFHPLRSLPWFQLPKLHMTSTARTADGDLEGGGAEAGPPRRDVVELAVDEHQIELHHDLGAREFRHSDIVLHRDDLATMRPETPTLRIMKRQSVEQESSYIGAPGPGPSPRRSIGALLPGHWLGGRGVMKKLLPRR